MMNEKERLQRATVIAQAVATVRKLTATNAPCAMQIHAIATLAKHLAPHTCGDKNHIDGLVMLLLDVTEATEALAKGSVVPDTVDELEDHFKRLDDAD